MQHIFLSLTNLDLTQHYFLFNAGRRKKDGERTTAVKVVRRTGVKTKMNGVELRITGIRMFQLINFGVVHKTIWL